jgi:hypothetical protein
LNLVLPSTFSEVIALEIAEQTGEYIGAQLFAGFMYIAAAFCMWMLKAWKTKQLEDMAVSAAIERGESVERLPRSSFGKRLFMWSKV